MELTDGRDRFRIMCLKAVDVFECGQPCGWTAVDEACIERSFANIALQFFLPQQLMVCLFEVLIPLAETLVSRASFAYIVRASGALITKFPQAKAKQDFR